MEEKDFEMLNDEIIESVDLLLTTMELICAKSSREKICIFEHVLINFMSRAMMTHYSECRLAGIEMSFHDYFLSIFGSANRAVKDITDRIKIEAYGKYH